MVTNMKSLAMANFFLLAGVVVKAHVHGDGMDMSMDGNMTLTSGNMVPYLHFTPGDTLWFQGWVPISAGAMIGTCIGLFLLALVHRWIAAFRSTAEIYWKKRAQIITTNKLAAATKGGGELHEPLLSTHSSLRRVLESPTAQPFIPTQDIARGVLHMGQTALGFALMLAIMTFQVGFILSIISGFGVGEMLFGRYGSGAGMH